MEVGFVKNAMKLLSIKDENIFIKNKVSRQCFL